MFLSGQIRNLSWNMLFGQSSNSHAIFLPVSEAAVEKAKRGERNCFSKKKIFCLELWNSGVDLNV